MTVAFPMLIYLTALGLGGFCRPLSGRGWPGLRWYLGFLLIPLLLLVINVALRIPIIPASRVVGLCAVAGLVFELRMSRTGPEPLFRWTHPVVVFPLVYLALSSGFGHRGYVASQFDEFTHWLLMPRQILLAGRPASHAIPFKSYADYTPGWSFLLLYPFAVLGAPFDTGPLLWVPFLSSVGLLAATFDVLCQVDSSERPSATLTAWAVILFLAALHAGACLSPTEVLIEPPLENAWAVLVLLLLFATPPHARGGSFVPLASGVVLACGYVLKKSFVAALPLGVALYSLSVEKSCDRRAARKATRSALLVLGPLGVAVTIWTISSRKFVPAFSLLATHSARSASVSVSAVFTAMTAATVGLLRAQGLFAGVCAVAALGLAIGRRARRALLAWTATCALYFLGLWRLYSAGEFPQWAPLELPGYARYVGAIGRVTGFLAVLGASSQMAAALGRRSPRALIGVSGLAITALSVMLVRDTIVSVRVLRAEDSLGGDFRTFIADAEHLRTAIASRGSPGAGVVVIAQDATVEVRFLRPLLQYVSLEEGSGVAFRLLAGPRFTTDAAGDGLFPRATPTTPARFKRLIRAADAIWPVRTSAWMAPIFAHLALEHGCSEELDRYFLIATTASDGRRRFTCVKHGDQAVP